MGKEEEIVVRHLCPWIWPREPPREMLERAAAQGWDGPSFPGPDHTPCSAGTAQRARRPGQPLSLQLA